MKTAVTTLIALTIITVCSADPITFIHEGRGSGSLDGVPFSIRDFVITAQGDTANRSFDGDDVYWINHDSAQIELAGLGTFDFISTTRTFVNQTSFTVGFSRSGALGADLFDGPSVTEYLTWDMLTSIGPHSGTGEFSQWEPPFAGINTSGGVLIFPEDISPATFTAIVVPEPSSVMLAAGSLLLLMSRR